MKLVYNFVHGRVIICHRKSISYFDFGFTTPYGTHFIGFTTHKCWLIWWFKDVMIALISHPQYLPYEWQYITSTSLQWRNNGRDGVSNQQPYHCLLTCLFRSRSKEISKLSVTGLCAGNSPVTVEFPAKLASNAENDSIRWRHHVK